jgi:antibiotic biosynthesis monooxygenase (ABM) superfamily enzyme
MKQAEKEILNRKTSLINLHYLAKVNGDTEMLEKINEDIAKFKQTFPGLINSDTLRRSEAQHAVRLRKSVDGVYLNKKTARYIQEELGS